MHRKTNNYISRTTEWFISVFGCYKGRKLIQHWSTSGLDAPSVAQTDKVSSPSKFHAKSSTFWDGCNNIPNVLYEGEIRGSRKCRASLKAIHSNMCVTCTWTLSCYKVSLWNNNTIGYRMSTVYCCAVSVQKWLPKEMIPQIIMLCCGLVYAIVGAGSLCCLGCL